MEEARKSSADKAHHGESESGEEEDPLVARIRELAEARDRTDPDLTITELAFGNIRPEPDIFQPRGGPGVNEQHVQELKKAIERSPDRNLEPVTVIQIGERFLLVDGHHRMAAYELAKRRDRIPVEPFDGTVKDAIRAAGTANSRAKLPMTNAQRQEFAWKLVCFGPRFMSKKEIEQTSGVSRTQVGNMRKAWRKVGMPGPEEREPWWKVMKLLPTSGFEDVEDRQSWIEAQAEALADKLARHFGDRLVRHPEIAALALEHHFGRRAREIRREWQDLAGDDDQDDDEDEDF